jgi:hypothetical protein
MSGFHYNLFAFLLQLSPILAISIYRDNVSLLCILHNINQYQIQMIQSQFSDFVLPYLKLQYGV